MLGLEKKCLSLTVTDRPVVINPRIDQTEGHAGSEGDDVALLVETALPAQPQSEEFEVTGFAAKGGSEATEGAQEVPK